MKIQKQGFTLVELIVVITILAILGTIAFISLQGYSKDSRNSTRVTDTASMKKTLELYQLKYSKLPMPDENSRQEVKYIGELLRTQGKFGKEVHQELGKLISKAPKDPLTNDYYIYSVENNNKKYEILTIYEGDDYIVNNRTKFLREAQAFNGFIPKIAGTYNKVFLQTDSYIVPSPTIINADIANPGTEVDLDETEIEDFMKSQVVNGQDNLPGIGEDIEGNISSISYSNYQVADISNGSLEDNKEDIINAFSGTYNGSNISGIEEIEYVLSGINNGREDDVFNFIVLNKTGKPTIVSNSGIKKSISDCGLVTGEVIYGTENGTDEGLTCEDDIIVCNGNNGSGTTIAACNLGATEVFTTQTFDNPLASRTIEVIEWAGGFFSSNNLDGVCEEGYHVPTRVELNNLYVGNWTNGGNMSLALKMPIAGHWNPLDGLNRDQGENAGYWCKNPIGDYLWFNTLDIAFSNITGGYKLSVRCFKD